MSNASGLRQKMEAIIAAIDSGEANPTKTLRALARAVDLLAKDIEGLEYREGCRELAQKPSNYDDVVRKMFGL